MFSEDEIERYARHLMLKEIGGEGQQRLKQATVTLAGLGGLGGTAGQYLAAAGVGRLRLVDPDTVSLSNLQRQVPYETADLNAPKPKVLARRLHALNPNVAIEHHERAFEANDLRGVDLALDGTDSFPARFAINQACVEAGVTLVSGALGPWSGQVGAFAPHVGDYQPCYACFVPSEPPEAEACAVHGVVGALAGVVACQMALEAIKLITGAGTPLLGRLWIYDALKAEGRTLNMAKDPACPVCAGAAAEKNTIAPLPH